LRENEQAYLFKESAMLKRFQDISTLPEKEKECLLTTIDHFFKASKIYLQKNTAPVNAESRYKCSGLYSSLQSLKSIR